MNTQLDLHLPTAILRDLQIGQSTADSITGRIHATEKRERIALTPTETITAHLGQLELEGKITSQTIRSLNIYRLTEKERQTLSDKQTN